MLKTMLFAFLSAASFSSYSYASLPTKPIKVGKCIVDPQLASNVEDIKSHRQESMDECMKTYKDTDWCTKSVEYDIKVAEEALKRSSDFFAQQEWGNTTIKLSPSTSVENEYVMHIKASKPWFNFEEAEFDMRATYGVSSNFYEFYANRLTLRMTKNNNQYDFYLSLVDNNNSYLRFQCFSDKPTPVISPPTIINNEIYDDQGELEFPRGQDDGTTLDHYYSMYASKYPAHIHYKFVNSSGSSFALGQIRINGGDGLFTVTNKCPKKLAAHQSCDVDFFFDGRGYVAVGGISVDFDGNDFRKNPVSFTFSSGL